MWALYPRVHGTEVNGRQLASFQSLRQVGERPPDVTYRPSEVTMQEMQEQEAYKASEVGGAGESKETCIILTSTYASRPVCVIRSIR